MPAFKCHAARDLPLDTDTAWDGAAASGRMLDAAHIGGDNPDFAQARRGFLLVDDSAKENRGSYSLPFADLKSGTLTALISGCRAAASRLSQKQGVSDGERAKARGVLDTYFKKASAGKKSSAAEELGCFGFRMPLLTVTERAQADSSDADLLTLAQAQASDPSIFEEYPPTFFSAAVSTNLLDAYYTKMHRSSLENFAADLSEGRSLQDSHNTRQLGLGYSLRGRYVGGGGNGVQRTVGDFYSVPADEPAQAFINKMRAGMVRDVSVGFYLGPDGRYVCDLCGQDMMGRACPHWPGGLYPESDKEGAAMVRATATIHEARLAEVSAVYDGATPGAVILKAQRAAEEGSLPPEMARELELRYRIALPAVHPAWAGFDPTQKEADMPDDTPRVNEGAEWTLPAAAREEFRSRCQEAGLSPDLLPAATLGELLTRGRALETERDALKAERDQLKPEAELGRAYRQDLIQETITEGVRAYGNAFPEAAERELLAGASLDTLKAKLTFYRAQARPGLPGGRATMDYAPAPEGSPQPATPDAAYRA